MRTHASNSVHPLGPCLKTPTQRTHAPCAPLLHTQGTQHPGLLPGPEAQTGAAAVCTPRGGEGAAVLGLRWVACCARVCLQVHGMWV